MKKNVKVIFLSLFFMQFFLALAEAQQFMNSMESAIKVQNFATLDTCPTDYPVDCGNGCCPANTVCVADNQCCGENTPYYCGNKTCATSASACPSTGCPAGNILGPDNPNLENLRNFRDNRLAQSAVGRKIIEIYYNNADSINAALETARH